MRSVFSVVRTLAIGTLFTAAAAASAMAQATLVSDKTDYAPGSTAYLTGAGFAANEAVTVQVVHDDGTSDAGEDHQPWDVVADGEGGFLTTWHVCEDDCMGAYLVATADGQSSGLHAEALFTDAVGTGVVTVTSVGGSCVAGTPPPGNGPFNWEVVQGGSYLMTITGVTECGGSAITVFAQSSSTGNFCFDLTGGSGTYSGTFTMPNPACFTYPLSYKCGAGAACNNANTFAALGPGGARSVHLRAATFDSNCNLTGKDEDCTSSGGCTPCVLVCPPDVTIDCSASTDPGSTGSPTGCADATFTDGPSVPGFCAGNFSFVRHWSAPNGCGDIATCDQTISVTDTTAPDITCPADVSIDCAASTDPADTGSATATDDCAGVREIVAVDTEVAGDCAGDRVITRTWWATDFCGNRSSCEQIITVSDTTAPSITCPADVGVDCAASTDPADTGSASATDDCSGVADISSSDSIAAGDCAGNSVITRTWTATDGCGNSASCDQIITVTDTTAPSITCPADVGVDCAASTDPADTGSASATDDCSGVADISSSDSIAAGDCAGNFVITRTWTATDGCGNSASCDQTISVTDTTAPSIECPADVIANGGGACCVPVDLGTATASDDCSGVDITNDAPATFCVGDTTVTWTATDGCGLASTCEQTVTVLGQICATKFYDANANGVRDDGELGVSGWQIVVQPGNHTQTTGADGTTCFDLPAGSYTVSEGTPSQTNWVHTTATAQDVTVGAESCAPSVSFGNYCFSAPANGLTLGFWSNKNGQKILQAHDMSAILPSAPVTPNWRSTLNALNLKNANGSDFVIPMTGSFANAYSIFRTWLLGANATNMAYMLSAQLAATTLDVKYNGLSDGQGVIVPGGVKTNANVCIVPFLSVTQAISCGAPPLLALTAVPGSTACGCSSNDGLVTIGNLRSRADCLLGAYPNTTAASTQRTYQECVKNILDMINNNGNNGYPCGGLSQYINAVSDACSASF